MGGDFLHGATIMQPPIRKYPRTRHIEGSRLQAGDEDLSQVPFSEVRGKHLIVEEKVDGANMAVSFAPDGLLLLQSRGHYLTGGSAFESQFDLVKSWAHAMSGRLRDVLGDRYVMYGECMYKKHTVFYDALPHYFMEFDVLDTQADRFLSTAARRRLLDELPVVSVPVLFQGEIERLEDLTAFVRPSLYKTPNWRATFERVVREQGLDVARAWERVEDSNLSEGLYVKWEEGDHIVRCGDGVDPQEGRYKWVRHDFHQRILDANEQARGHVGFQPTIPNQLAEGVDLWAG